MKTAEQDRKKVNRRTGWRVGLLVCLLCVFGITTVSASTKRPSVIVYGMVRDSFGIRLPPESAMVGAFLGTNETARTAIRPLLAGANYRFDVNVSDPLTAGPKEIKPGDLVSIRVRVGGVLQPTIGNSTFIAQGDGPGVNINLILGVDSDGDGLPDDWEWLMIANSGGQVNNLSQVGPGRDLDGDGVPDDQEFWNGTFAFLPDDLLRLANLTQHANGRLSFRFLPIEGISYVVEVSPNLDSPTWTTCPISLTETGSLVAGPVTGGTAFITLFVEPGPPRRFWRLRRQ